MLLNLCRRYGSISTRKNVISSHEEQISSVLQHAIKNKYLSSTKPMALIIDLNAFKSRCNELHDSFYQHGLSDEFTTHTFAMKALPLPSILKQTKDLHFEMGIECASFGELAIALDSDIESSQIVFDSACKTYDELQHCLENDIFINLDNFQELDRVRNIIKENKNNNIDLDKIKIGMRVNPVVGSGDIESTSTATMYSKFGVNLHENKENLIRAYLENEPWLNSIHCHIGSQGCAINMICDGIAKTVQFAEEINKIKGEMIINTIDIGGGLPVNYDGSQHKPTFYDLVKELKTAVPVIFDNKYHIYTEFGRSLIQKCGFIASVVEYTKEINDKHIATIHCGANVLLREAYNPQNWKHQFSVYNNDGSMKQNDAANKNYKYDIAGPLCFSGDLMAHDRLFPYEIKPNDFIAIHDAAGYSVGMYSMYNSRPFPPIYGFDYAKKNENDFISVLKSQQTNKDLVDFWNN